MGTALDNYNGRRGMVDSVLENIDILLCKNVIYCCISVNYDKMYIVMIYLSLKYIYEENILYTYI